MPFVKERSDLGALGVEVVALSPFSLASDTDLAVARALGVADENSRRAALVPDAAGSATKDALKKLRAFDYAKSHGQTTSSGSG